MKSSDYFTISHYLPEGVYQRNKEMAKYLRNSHFCKRGLHTKEAEQQFLRYVQEMKEYGLHLYSAVWVIFVNQKKSDEIENTLKVINTKISCFYVLLCAAECR